MKAVRNKYIFIKRVCYEKYMAITIAILGAHSIFAAEMSSERPTKIKGKEATTCNIIHSIEKKPELTVKDTNGKNKVKIVNILATLPKY